MHCRIRTAAVGAVVLLAALASVLPIKDPINGYDYLHTKAGMFTPGHLFGTDDSGNDVLSRVIWGAQASLLIGVGSRLFYLQVLRYDYYSNLSQGNRIRTEPIPPSRGLILDRHGVVLADNLPAFNVELVREQVGDIKALDATLAQLVSIGLLRSEEVGNIRRTVLLHKVYESVPVKLLLNEEEMARALRLPIGTVRSRLHRARHRFRQHWYAAPPLP